VPVLAHPNGWWRITAQRLLVERGDRSVAPALRQLARSSADDRARLHALWTLDGLGEADVPTVQRALADSSAQVRAAAIRIAEPWLAQASHAMQERVLALASDRAPVVRRQLSASLGELVLPARDAALIKVIAASGDDPVVADLVVTALAGREIAFLDALLASRPLVAERIEPVMRSLAAAVLASRDVPSVQRLVALVGQSSRPRWQRLALLGNGRAQAAPSFGAAEGQPTGRRGGGIVVSLPAEPRELIATMASSDTVLRAQATRFADALTWPGRTARRPQPRSLTPDEQARFAAGEKQYLGTCAGCHQAGGTGLAGVAKPLVGSPWVLGPPVRLIRIVLHGKEGEMLMPPVGASLSNEQLASVLTYVRRSWGNDASPVSPTDVRESRGATAGRSKPWTEAELMKVNR
ncbi:MAG: c-type cytochrome, partial [Gemmatimonadaceae bacterium]